MPYVIRKSGKAGGEVTERSAKITPTQRVKLPPPVGAPKKPPVTIIQQPQPANS